MRAMETNKNFQYLQECMDWVNNQLVSGITDITRVVLFSSCTIYFACYLHTFRDKIRIDFFCLNPEFVPPWILCTHLCK